MLSVFVCYVAQLASGSTQKCISHVQNRLVCLCTHRFLCCAHTMYTHVCTHVHNMLSFRSPTRSLLTLTYPPSENIALSHHFFLFFVFLQAQNGTREKAHMFCTHKYTHVHTCTPNTCQTSTLINNSFGTRDGVHPVLAHVHTHVHTCTHMYTHVHTCTHTCTHVHTHVHMYTHMYTHTHNKNIFHTRNFFYSQQNFFFIFFFFRRKIFLFFFFIFFLFFLQKKIFFTLRRKKNL